MYPSDGIRSQLEWNSHLSTENAPVAKEVNKHWRKV
jgi:pyruvate kinase